MRKEMEKIKDRATDKNYILVYQTSKSNSFILSILSSIKESFIVYGLNQESQFDNVLCRGFNETVFIEDVANCKAIITNGGFSLLAEAVYLKKPILSIPVTGQFEQINNSRAIESLGFGEFHKEFTIKGVESFLSNIEEYKANLKKFKYGPSFWDELDTVIQCIMSCKALGTSNKEEISHA